MSPLLYKNFWLGVYFCCQRRNGDIWGRADNYIVFLRREEIREQVKNLLASVYPDGQFFVVPLWFAPDNSMKDTTAEELLALSFSGGMVMQQSFAIRLHLEKIAMRRLPRRFGLFKRQAMLLYSLCAIRVRIFWEA